MSSASCVSMLAPCHWPPRCAVETLLKRRRPARFVGSSSAARWAMSVPSVQFYDETECLEVEAFLVERIYEFNARATGFYDGRLLWRRHPGRIGPFDCSLQWSHVGQLLRHCPPMGARVPSGPGFGRALLQAAETEAVRRGCEQIVLRRTPSRPRRSTSALAMSRGRSFLVIPRVTPTSPWSSASGPKEGA